jgi:hypothetical protein
MMDQGRKVEGTNATIFKFHFNHNYLIDLLVNVGRTIAKQMLDNWS